MIGTQLRVVILASADLADLHELLRRLLQGDTLTALETGVADESSINNADLVGEPTFLFDGFRFSAWISVTN